MNFENNAILLNMKVKAGQECHKIDYNNQNKKLILTGIEFEEKISLLANKDLDIEKRGKK